MYYYLHIKGHLQKQTHVKNVLEEMQTPTCVRNLVSLSSLTPPPGPTPNLFLASAKGNRNQKINTTTWKICHRFCARTLPFFQKLTKILVINKNNNLFTVWELYKLNIGECNFCMEMGSHVTEDSPFIVAGRGQSFIRKPTRRQTPYQMDACLGVTV